MNRFETDGDFQPPGNHVCELESSWTNGVCMRFDCDGSKGRGQSRNRREILGWYCTRIEEVAGVVQLQSILGGAGALFEHTLQLLRQRAHWGGSVDRKSPQVAERASERTLSAGQKNGKCMLDPSIRAPLIFDQRSLRDVGIDLRLGRTKASNPLIDSRCCHTTAAYTVSKWRR